jgi:hypothetical protein
MLGGMRGQVNESDGVGGGSEDGWRQIVIALTAGRT